MGYRLSREASDDITHLYLAGLDQFGLTQADRYHKILEETFDLLADNPRMGRERTEFTPPVRVHPFRSHIILYQIEGTDVLIIRVRHAHEDWMSQPDQG